MSVLRLAGIVWESIVDGPGVRCAVFAQGCPHHCEGCHNPQTWSYKGGFDAEPSAIVERMKKNPLICGVTLTGGEPFCQAAAMSELAAAARSAGYNVIAYTGYTFEQLLEIAAYDPSVAKMMELTDLLVDGPFIQAQRTLGLSFRGSANQRIIQMRQSIQDRVVRLAEV